MSENLNTVGAHATLSVGSLILNDYALSMSSIDGGHRLTITRGSEVQTMDVLDGVDGADVNEEFGTDEEIVLMLVEQGVMNIMQDSDGSIITDGDGSLVIG